MPIIVANIVKSGTRKEEQKPKPVSVSIKNIHEVHMKKLKSGANFEQSNLAGKPKKIGSHQEKNEINKKKTSRYLEDLTNKGDN